MPDSKLKNDAEGYVTNKETDRCTDSHSFASIPTTDPEAALKFCQYLSHNLTTRPGLSVTGEIQSLLKDASENSSRSRLTEPELSVVLPVYNEEDNISVLYSQLTRVLQEIEMGYEIIFVDDSSRDKSPEVLHGLAAKDHHVTVVDLARNFGHQVAITAGLDHARGKAVIVMDADLQDSPEVLPQFIAKWREGYDVVYAIREHRQESWFKRAAYSTFYRLLHRVANIEIPLDAGDFCIMDRKVVNLLRSMPERNRFVRGIRSWVGLNQTGLPCERQARHGGKPKYTFGRLMLLALDGLISFSYVPLRIITVLGFSVSLLSIILAVFYTVKKLFYALSPPGFATLVVSIFFLAGIQLITVGVMGEYIGRIFDEVKQRPLYVVRKITGKQR